MPLHSANKNQMLTGVMSPVFTVAVCDVFPAVVFPVVPLPGVVVPDEVPASNTSAYAENLSVAKVMVPLAASYVAGSFS